jgi:hypothetical protein
MKIKPRNREESELIAACLMLVSCFVYSSTLKIGEMYSSETSVGFFGITQLYIPEYTGWARLN